MGDRLYDFSGIGAIKMSQTEQINDEARNGPAFTIDSLGLSSGEVVIVVQKGIIGALSNQLKSTSNRRKGGSILRKMGHTLSDCGDVLYGKDVCETDLDTNLIDEEVHNDESQ